MKDILKKNMLSVICGVVALVALVAAFYPLRGMQDQQKQEINTEAQRVFVGLNGLVNKRFELPIIDVRENSEPKPLPVFPYPALITNGQALVKDLKSQADNMTKVALDGNRRQPLAGVRLSGHSVNAPDKRRFMNAYYREFEVLTRDRLNAGGRPRQEEIDAAIEARWNDFWQKQLQFNNQGQALNEQQVREMADKEAETWGEKMKRETAQRLTMYLAAERKVQSGRSTEPGGRFYGTGNSETTFDYFPGIPDPSGMQLPNPTDMWVAQLGMWIQSEVCQAIADTNKTADTNKGRATVEIAPVKRLVSIRVPPYYQTPKGPIAISKTTQDTTQGGGRTMRAANAPRGDVMPQPDAGIEVPTDNEPTGRAFEVSMTGRASNRDYDVMHFTVVVDIEAAYYRPFMANLTNGRFITILKSEYTSVNLEREFQRGYVYGDNPVIQLKLQCEAIFLREWTQPLMPQEVKDLLKITPPSPDQQQVVTRN